MTSSWLERMTEVNDRTRQDRIAAPPRLADQVTGPHQIGFRLAGHRIAVTCACLRQPRRGRPGYGFIDIRPVFPAAEALAAWRAWHEQDGVRV